MPTKVKPLKINYKSPELTEPVEHGRWGVAAVVKGRLKGHVVEYDDDMSEKTALVYLKGTDGYAIFDVYYTIPRSYMRRLKDEQ